MELKKIFSLIKKREIDFVDLRFVDLRGVWQHMTIPASEFSLENIKKGYGFDGSSIKGFEEIYSSDMVLIPDLNTCFIDPFLEKTLTVVSNVWDPEKGCFYEKDPRFISQKAESYLKKSGIADISFWGPEIEFFLFDRLEFSIDRFFSYFKIKSSEFWANEEGDGYPVDKKQGYFPLPPYDKTHFFREQMVKILLSLGIKVEVHHHEVASGGQVEIDLRYDSLTKMADKVMIYKYIARNLAKRLGMTAVFLPKPLYDDNGSGMHTHQSLFKNGRNLFYEKDGYGQLSKMGLSYIAGLLYHIKPLLAFTNPTVNSYRRLVPHFEAPTRLAFSKRNRSAAVRIPVYFKNEEKTKRIEFRCPDPTANPYLSFSAMLIFGLEGVKKKIDPTKLGFGPYDENIWEKDNVRQTPKDIFEVLEALEKDKILKETGVFSSEFLKSYLTLKKEEARRALMYPTPADFWFYGDI